MNSKPETFGCTFYKSTLKPSPSQADHQPNPLQGFQGIRLTPRPEVFEPSSGSKLWYSLHVTTFCPQRLTGRNTQASIPPPYVPAFVHTPFSSLSSQLVMLSSQRRPSIPGGCHTSPHSSSASSLHFPLYRLISLEGHSLLSIAVPYASPEISTPSFPEAFLGKALSSAPVSNTVGLKWGPKNMGS